MTDPEIGYTWELVSELFRQTHVWLSGETMPTI